MSKIVNCICYLHKAGGKIAGVGLALAKPGNREWLTRQAGNHHIRKADTRNAFDKIVSRHVAKVRHVWPVMIEHSARKRLDF